MEDNVSKSGFDKSNKENVPTDGNTINFDILHVLKEAQGQHGLKHGDYQRYRGYCSRRLMRIRKSLHYVQSSGGKRSAFQSKKITGQMVYEADKNNKDPIRYLLIPLMEAERAWAYAMQLKQEANTEQRKKFHLVRRLKKAVKSAQVLESFCNDEPTRCDARTKLESQAYAAYFNGLFYFETEEWQKAAEFFKKAQTIYQKIFETIEDEEIANCYKQRCDEIKPTLRYCAFNIGEQDIGAQDFISNLQNEALQIEDEFLSSKFEQLILQTREKQADALSEINWLGKTFIVKQEKIKSFLLLYESIKNVESPKISQLEKVLFECRDCIQLLRESNQEKSEIFCYLTYIRLQLTCKRSLQLIKPLKNPNDLMRLYEIIVGNLTEIQSLPLDQYFSDDNSLEKFHNEIDTQITAYRAYRCYYIGLIIGKNNYKDAVGIMDRCSQYCKSGIENENTSKELKDGLKQLLSKAEGEKYAIYANNVMKGDEERNKPVKPPSKKGKKKNDPANVQLSPDSKLIPCKPLFFDLALNHIEFPSLEEELASDKPGGITGLVKGWLGGWRK